jgi:hypothetical protein
MTTARPLPQSPPPEGTWADRTDWLISSIDEAVAVRGAARNLVGPESAADPTQPVFASTRARVEVTMGELVVNGLRHGGQPVRASLSRGEDGWLLVVSDPATGRPPLVTSTPNGVATGGLGVRLVVAIATTAGWYTDGDEKHVWALIGDQPPPHLLTALEP